tara:strand:- start:399 stop:701 length:303 start_codon:yes stop_codon:yes gene_type:complete
MIDIPGLVEVSGSKSRNRQTRNGRIKAHGPSDPANEYSIFIILMKRQRINATAIRIDVRLPYCPNIDEGVLADTIATYQKLGTWTPREPAVGYRLSQTWV